MPDGLNKEFDMRATIKLKLASAFAFVIVLLIGTASYGVYSLGTLNQTLSDVLDGPVDRLKLAQQIDIYDLQAIRQQKNLLAATTEDEATNARTKGDTSRALLDQTLTRVIEKATELGRPKWLQLEDLVKQSNEAEQQIRSFLAAGNRAAAA